MNDTMTRQARPGRKNNNCFSRYTVLQLLRNVFYMEQRSKSFTRVAERFID